MSGTDQRLRHVLAGLSFPARREEESERERARGERAHPRGVRAHRDERRVFRRPAVGAGAGAGPARAA